MCVYVNVPAFIAMEVNELKCIYKFMEVIPFQLFCCEVNGKSGFKIRFFQGWANQ